MQKRTLSLMSTLFLASSCQTSSMSEQIRMDLITTNAKLVQLERRMDASGRGEEDSAKKIAASAKEKVDTLDDTLKQIQGDLDALQTGFQSGKLPGAPEDEPSIGTILEGIQQRVLALEATQADLLKLLEQKGFSALASGHSKADKASDKAPQTASPKDSDAKILDVASMKDAYKHRRISAIIDAYPFLKKDLKGKDAQDAKLIYAESLFRIGKLSEAALTYNELLREKALKEKHSYMIFRMGECFRRLGDQTTATVYYKELLEKFPKSDEAKKAKEHLSTLVKR